MFGSKGNSGSTGLAGYNTGFSGYGSFDPSGYGTLPTRGPSASVGPADSGTVGYDTGFSGYDPGFDPGDYHPMAPRGPSALSPQGFYSPVGTASQPYYDPYFGNGYQTYTPPQDQPATLPPDYYVAPEEAGDTGEGYGGDPYSGWTHGGFGGGIGQIIQHYLASYFGGYPQGPSGSPYGYNPYSPYAQPYYQPPVTPQLTEDTSEQDYGFEDPDPSSANQGNWRPMTTGEWMQQQFNQNQHLYTDTREGNAMRRRAVNQMDHAQRSGTWDQPRRPVTGGGVGMGGLPTPMVWDPG